MHITIIHPSMHFIGGAERLITDLALGLADGETMVEVVTGVCHNLWRSELSQKANSVSVKELGHIAPGSLGFWLNVKGFVKAFAKLINPETDVIITSSFPSNLSADLFTKWHDVKILHYLHEAPMVLHDKESVKTIPLRLKVFYRFASSLYAKWDVEAVRRSAVILANSRLCKRVNAETYGVDESHIEVVYPGVNLGCIAPSVAVPPLIRKPVKEGIPVIFFPRGTQFWRNPKVCLRALQSLRTKRFVAVFTGGSKHEAISLIKCARALKIAEKVIRVQELTNYELNAVYSHSSLVISIPRRQPFGLIPLEALVCRTPPVISSPSGVSEVLRDGIDAICVHEGDLNELVDAIEMLMLDTENRSRIVFNGRQKVLSEFTSSRFANEMRDNLLKLAG